MQNVAGSHALEIWVFRARPFALPFLGASLCGLAGVALLSLHDGGRGGAPLLPCLVVLVGATGWSLGSVLAKQVRMPDSRVVTAGAEMTVGGLGLLVCSAGFGELQQIHAIPTAAWEALAYLVTVGSLIGFSAFVWLLSHYSASQISSYAYVNPVVAMLLGYYLGGETIAGRTLWGAMLVLLSVLITVIWRDRKPQQDISGQTKTESAATGQKS